MNSYKWRMQFIQLPARIKELRDAGYLIVTKQNANRSVNYILIDEPKKQTSVMPKAETAKQEELFN